MEVNTFFCFSTFLDRCFLLLSQHQRYFVMDSTSVFFISIVNVHHINVPLTYLKHVYALAQTCFKWNNMWYVMSPTIQISWIQCFFHASRPYPRIAYHVLRNYRRFHKNVFINKWNANFLIRKKACIFLMLYLFQEKFIYFRYIWFSGSTRQIC